MNTAQHVTNITTHNGAKIPKEENSQPNKNYKEDIQEYKNTERRIFTAQQEL